MRLEISNFRCYRREVIDFNQGVITLLRGVTGAGKTTILTAILWALYGQRGLAKKQGEKEEDKKRGNSTWVEISWTAEERFDGKALIIRRVQGNNKLTVNYDGVEVQGQSAQDMVVRLFGTEALWKSSSYIQQGANCAILELSKKETLTELNRLAFHAGGLNQGDLLTPDEARAKIDEYTKKLETEYTSTTSLLSQAEGALAHFRRKHPDLPEMVEGVSESDARERVAYLTRVKSAIENACLMYGEAVRRLSSAKVVDTAELETRLVHAERTLDAIQRLQAYAGIPPPQTLEEPRPPTIDPALVGENRPFAEKRPLPTQPKFHDVTPYDVSAACAAERDAEWLASTFSSVLYDKNSVNGFVEVIALELDAREAKTVYQNLAEGHDERLAKMAEMQASVEIRQRAEKEIVEKRQALAKWGKRVAEVKTTSDYISEYESNAEVARKVQLLRGKRAPSKVGDIETIQVKIHELRRMLDGYESREQLNESVESYRGMLSLAQYILKREAIEKEIAAIPRDDTDALNLERDKVQKRLERLEVMRGQPEMSCPCCSTALFFTGIDLVAGARDERVSVMDATARQLQSSISQIEASLASARTNTLKLSALNSQLAAYPIGPLSEFQSLLDDEGDLWRTEKRQSEIADYIESGTAALALTAPSGLFFDYSFDTPDNEVGAYMTFKLYQGKNNEELSWIINRPIVATDLVTLRQSEKAVIEMEDAREDLTRIRAEIQAHDSALARVNASKVSGHDFSAFSTSTLRAHSARLSALTFATGRFSSLPSSRLKEMIEDDRVARIEYDRAVAQVREMEHTARKANVEYREYTNAVKQYERAVLEEAEYQNKRAERGIVQGEVDALGMTGTSLSSAKDAVIIARNALDAARYSNTEHAAASELKRDCEERWKREIPAEFSFPMFVVDAITPALVEAESVLANAEGRSSAALLREESSGLVSTVEKARAESTACSVELEKARTLRKLCESVETRMLERIIQELNNSLRDTCACLFDEGVTIYVSITKQNASNDGVRTAFEIHKLSMVDGVELDITLPDMSGGEGARVAFAMALAMADLPAFHASPLLMLDEVTAPLDDDMCELVMEALRVFVSRRPHKTVITIVQGLHDGMFDKVKYVSVDEKGISRVRNPCC